MNNKGKDTKYKPMGLAPEKRKKERKKKAQIKIK